MSVRKTVWVLLTDVIRSRNIWYRFIDTRINLERNMPNIDIWAPFYKHGLTLISAWISNHVHYKLWDEITYPFLNFNGCTVEV